MTAIALASAAAELTRVEADGLLRLTLRKDRRGRTVISSRAHCFPLRMTVPLYLDELDPSMAFVHIQNPTGGVFPGDQLTVEVSAEREARVHIATQSATKLVRSDTGEKGIQTCWITVGPDAVIEMVPDALIPHAGARYEQRTTVELAVGGRFISCEILQPGRVGEFHRYREIGLRTAIERNGRELCVDATRFQPGTRPVATPGLLGRYGYYASLTVAAPEDDMERLAAELTGTLRLAQGVLAAAGALPGNCGVGARILGRDGETVRRTLRSAWGVARERLLGVPIPPLRKW